MIDNKSEKITFSDITKKMLSLVIALFLLTFFLVIKPKKYDTLNVTYYYISLIIFFLVCSYYVYICLPYSRQKILDSTYQVCDFLNIFIIACLVFQICFSFFYFKANVEGTSMEPNFIEPDTLIVKVTNKLDNFDVVVVSYNTKDNEEVDGLFDGDLLIKRVIGKPGDTFYYVDTVLFLNDKRIDEDYLDEDYVMNIDKNNPSLEKYKSYEGVVYSEERKAYIIDEGYYFLMGDHRNVSNDSRRLGLFHESQIIGVAKFRLHNLFNWEKVK